MPKQPVISTAFFKRAAALIVRLCLLPAIWHAPLPSLHVHSAESGSGHAHHHADEPGVAPTETVWELNFLLPCEMNGCRHSLPLDGGSESDHSRHIAVLGFGAPAKTDTQVVDRGLSAGPRGASPLHTTMPATDDATARLLTLAAHRHGATPVSGAEDAPTLPLYAALHAFLI